MVLEDLPFIGGPLWILVIGATLLELISMAYDLAVQAEAVSVAVWFFVAGGIVTITLSLPLLIGLYIYAFRSEQWDVLRVMPADAKHRNGMF